MERPQDIDITPRVAIIIIILFHAVGLIGFCIPVLRPLFLQLVPWHLLLMLAVVVLSHSNRNNQFALFVLIVFLLGFMAEWIGVHKGWLFGNYTYGKTLGLKLFNIPLMIGVNWFLLVYATGVTLQHSRLKNRAMRILTGAAIMVMLDLLIEPVAIKFGYWSWTDNIIPIKNYGSWFLVSAVMFLIFEMFKFKKQSRAGLVLLITEFIFFGVLGVVVRF